MPRQGCNTRKPLIRAQSKTVLTAHGSPTNGRLVVGKYLEDCKLITLHIPFKFLLDLLYTNKDSSLLSQTHGTTAVTSTSYTWKSSTVLIFFLNIGHICINSCNVHLSCFTKGIQQLVLHAIGVYSNLRASGLKVLKISLYFLTYLPNFITCTLYMYK